MYFLCLPTSAVATINTPVASCPPRKPDPSHTRQCHSQTRHDQSQTRQCQKLSSSKVKIRLGEVHHHQTQVATRAKHNSETASNAHIPRLLSVHTLAIEQHDPNTNPIHHKEQPNNLTGTPQNETLLDGTPHACPHTPRHAGPPKHDVCQAVLATHRVGTHPRVADVPASHSVMHRFVDPTSLPNARISFIQKQQRGRCLLHAVNNGLQNSVLHHNPINALIHRQSNQPATADGWYNIDEITTALHTLSGGHLTLTAGSPHYGLTDGMTWQQTLATQRTNARTAPFAILLTHTAGHAPFQKNHAVCAISRTTPTDGTSWYILDSCHPNKVGPLSSDEIATAFDASVHFLTFTDSPSPDSPLPTRQQAVRYLRQPSPRSQNTDEHPTDPPSPPWPGYIAPHHDTTWTTVPYQQLTLRLFTGTTTLRNRTSLLHISNKEQLYLITRARYCTENDHIKLTITTQGHLHAIHTSDMSQVAETILTRTGWRLVGWRPTSDPPQRPPPPHTLTSNRFHPLQNASPGTCTPETTPPQAPTPPTQRGRHANAHRTRQRRTNNTTIGTFNINGLNNDRSRKLNAIQALMTHRKITILAVQETHEHNSDRIVATEGYTYQGELAHGPRKGGGSGFLSADTIQHCFTYLGRRTTTQYSTTWGHLAGHSKDADIFIGNVYLPDTGKSAATATKARAQLALDIAHYQAKPGHVLLLGDFNAHVAGTSTPDDPSHPTHAPLVGMPSSNRAGQKLLALCEEEDMFFLTGRQQSPLQPTCRNATVVDHIIGSRGTLSWATTATTAPSETDVLLCNSDHNPAYITVPTRQPTSKATAPPYSTWRLANLDNPEIAEAYVTALTTKSRALHSEATKLLRKTGPITQTDVDHLATTLETTINDAAKQTLGQKRTAPGKTKPYMTTSLRQTLDHRHNAVARWKTHKTAEHSAALEAADLAAKTALRTAKREHSKRTAERVNKAWEDAAGDHKAWRKLQSMKSTDATSRDIDALHDENGTLVTDPSAVLATLTAHYRNLAVAPPPVPAADAATSALRASHDAIEHAYVDMLIRPSPDDPVNDAPINRPELDAILNKLKRYKSPGHDGIPAELLRGGGDCMVSMLTSFFRVIWTSELVPSAWRKGIVVSIYKAGDRTQCGNYRPITLLPTIDKVFTAVLAARLEKSVALHEHQSAFRRGRGTMDPLFVLTSITQHRKSLGLRTHGFFLDLKKAYDMVWHAGLFYKLHQKGIKAKTWRIIHELYANGTSRAKLSRQEGEPYPILQGVAQGCPMSCILFAIMIDDLLQELQSQCQEEGISMLPNCDSLVAQGFADDIEAVSGTRAGLQTIINTFKRHLDKWKGVANTSKCHTLVFNPGGSASDPSGNPVEEAGEDAWHWGDTALENRTKTKNLGIVLTSDCKWIEHAKLARAKGRAALHVWMKALSNKYLSIRTKLAIINTCIKPCMTYGMEIWTPPPSWQQSLETPVRNAIRIALGIPKGPERSRYPSDLLHYDTAVRPVASDNIAAHVRYWNRIRNLPAVRPQRQALDMLPVTNSWNRRTRRWRDAIVAADPEAPAAGLLQDDPQLPPNTDPETAPATTSNRDINIAIAKHDAREYARKAHARCRPILVEAVAHHPCTAMKPYIPHRHAPTHLLFRSGHFQRDEPTPTYTGMGPPPYTECNECSCTVNAEDYDLPDDVREFRVMLHRVTACETMAPVINWYHDTAIRICPTTELARAILDAQRADTLWADERFLEWEAACLPFLRHLLSPTDVCAPTNFDQHKRMMHATHLFLITTGPNINSLPCPSSFGNAPTTNQGNQHVPTLAPPAHVPANYKFWQSIRLNLPPRPSSVPPSQRAVVGAEVEAPRARPGRRVSRHPRQA